MFNEEDRKWLYGQFKDNGYDTGSYEDFIKSLDNDEDFKWWHEQATSLGLEVGDLNEFGSLFRPTTETEQVERVEQPAKPARQIDQAAAAEGRQAFQSAIASRSEVSTKEDIPQATQKYMAENPVEGGQRDFQRTQIVDQVNEVKKVNEPIVAEYERIWNEYQRDIDNELGGPEIDAKKAWLDEHQQEYAEAKKNIQMADARLNYYDKPRVVEEIDSQIAENQKHVAPKAISTTGTGFFPTQGGGYNMEESHNYEAANEILGMAKQTYQQGSKADPGYEGNWLEQAWTAARQFVEGGINNVDMGSLTYGLSEGSALIQARRVGDKYNKAVEEAYKNAGYSAAELSDAIDEWNWRQGELVSSGEQLNKEAADLDAMASTINKWTGSQEELNKYIRSYNKKLAEHKKNVKQYNADLAEYKRKGSKIDAAMESIQAAVEGQMNESEMALLNALMTYTEAKIARQNDVSVASAAGAGAEQSAEFMLDFILTGGLEGVGTKLAGKILGRQATKRAGIGTKMLGDVISSAMRTAVMFPRNLAAYGENLAAIDVEASEKGDGQIVFDRSHLNAALNTALTQYIEYWSEGFGEYFGAAERKLFQTVTRKAPKTAIGKTLTQYRGSIGQYLDHGKFNGQFNEMLEEVVGSGFNALAGWMSGDRVGDSKAMKEFWAGDNLATLFFSFLPMSAISARTNIKAYNRMKEHYDNGVAVLNPFVDKGAISQEDLDELVGDIENKTPEEIVSKIEDITDKARKANGGFLPQGFAQALMGYCEGTFAMGMRNDVWEDSAEKMGVVNAYSQFYANPDPRAAYDLSQAEQQAYDAAIQQGYSEEDLDQDAYILAQQALANEDPVLQQYAEAKAAMSGLRDGYDAETIESAKNLSDSIEQKCDINGNIIRATLADGTQVFITSKDASVGPDGKLNTPTGADGLVNYIKPDGSEDQAKASVFTSANSQDTTLYLIESEDVFKQSRDLVFEQALNTVSPLAKAKALYQMQGQNVIIEGNGAYEPVRVERLTHGGENVVISGDRDVLQGVAMAAGINSPGGTRLEIPVENLWDMLAKENDGSLSTEVPQGQPQQSSTTAAPQSTTTQSVPGGATLDGRPIGDIRIDEQNGEAYFTFQDDPDRILQTMDLGEFRQKTGQAQAPAAPEAPATPAGEVPKTSTEVPEGGTPQSKIPVDKDGNKIYDAPGVEPIDAYEDMYSTEGLSEADVDEWVISQSDEAEKNRNPKIKKGQSLQEWGKEKAEANRKADFWKELRDVAEEHVREREEAAKREADLQAQIEKYGVDTRGFDLTPQTTEEAVAEYLGNSEKLIDLEDAKKETLGKSKSGRVPAELFRHLGNGGILTSKGGRTIQDVANDIVGEYEGTLAITQDEVRDIIIDYLTRYTKSEMREMIFNNRLQAALDELEQQNGTSEQAEAETAEEVEDIPEAEEEQTPAEEAVEEAPEGTEVPEAEVPESVPVEEGGDSTPTAGGITYDTGGLTGNDMIELWRNRESTKEADKGKPGRTEIITAIYEANPNEYAFENEGQQKLAIEKVLQLARQYPNLGISKEILSRVKAEQPAVEQPEGVPENNAPESSETPENSVPSQEKGDEIAAGTQAVVDMAQQLGFTPVIIRSINDIPEYEARARQVAETQGLDKIRAWVNTATGQVFVVDGNISEQEAAAIVQHEIVAHIGLPQLLGEEDYNALCDAVWDGMSEDDSMLFGLYALGAVAPSTATTYDAKVAWAKSVFEQFSQEDYDKINSPAISRKAAGEYMASLAERETFTEEDKTVWQRIKDAVRVFLTRVKIGINNAITDEDIRTLIRASREALSVGAQTEAERDEAVFLIPESALSQGDKDRMLNIMEQAGVVGDEMRDARRYLSGENTGLIVRASYLQAKQKALEYVRSRSVNLQQNRSAEDTAHVDEQVPGNQGRGSMLGSRGQTVGVGTTTGEDGVPGESDTAGGNGGGNTAGANGEPSNSGVSGNGTESVGKPASGKQSGGSRGTGGNGQKSGTGRARGQKGSGTAGENTSRGTDSKPDVAATQAEVDSILDALDNLGSDATQFALRGAPTAGKLNTADRKDGVITLEGKSPEQISLIAKLGKALAKAGVALIQSGVRAFNLWHGQMKSRFGQKLKENKVLRLTDEQVDNYINEIWETDFEIDGRVLRVREWADEIGRESLRNVMRMTEAEKRRLQKAADGVVPVIGDMANIREMLPFLLPEQQEDVLKAETQFFDKSHADKEHGNGKGYLFTNATGTGKTFTGAGIIKRFVKSGKGRVLIVTPTQNKVSDWISEGARLDLQINGLVDTNDVGEGVVATTYSNFAQNEALMNEDFDLIVYDESHNITRSIHGQTETARLKAHFQLANKDVDYAMERLTTYSPFFRELHDWEKRVEDNQAKIAEDVDRMNADGPTAELRDEVARLERENRELQQRINEAQPRIPEETEKLRPRAKAAVEKTKVVFLSASAFATHASLHYAEGFIFSFPDVERVPVGTDRATLDKMKLANFLVQRFPHGYRRKNQTTVNQVVSDADRLEEEEVAFAEYLFSGLQTASGRTLTTEYDYARKFPPLQLDMADRINSAENAILTDHELAPLKEALKKTLYDYNYGNALLETMKATLIIPYIRQFVAKGKKVVIFHSRLTSREPLQPPFERILELAATLAENNPNISTTQLMHAQEKFRSMFADVLQWEQRLNYQLPREQIAQALGADNVMLYSGQETPKTKEKNVGKFQDDNSGKNIIIVQTQSGSEGISLHDKTGKYPRVTINLSLPRSPIVAIQGEGRTLRIGSQSNAIFWYPLLGLEFERQLFATIFAGRAGTQENLSMGPMARGLRNSFMNGILEHSGVVDMNEDSGGKAYDAKKEAGDSTYEDAVRDYHESQASPAEGEDNADGLPTPEPLGFKMVQWAGLIEGESVLEPSAGRGAIARFVTKRNKLKGMDSNSGLVSRLMLKLSGGGRSFEVSRFEDYDIHNKHDVVLMNPPTGAEGLNTAYLHLSKAFKHLVEGGRIVAVVPADTDIKDMDDSAVLSGEVTLPTIITGQRGPMKVLVIDKVSRKGAREKFTEFKKVDLSNATTVEEFFARLRDVDMPARKIDESAKVEKAINTLKKAMKVEGKKGIIREDRTPWVPEVRPVKKKEISYWKKQLPGVAELDDDAIVGFSVVFLKQRTGYTYQLSADSHEGEFVIASPIQMRKELLYVRGRINSMSRAQDNGNLRRGADHTLEFYQKVYDVMLATAGVTEEDMDSKWFELGELTPEEAALRDRVYASTDEEIEALDQYYYDIYRANSGQKERQAQRMRQIIDKAKKDLYDGSVQRRNKESDWKSLGVLSESEKQLRDRLRELPLMQIKAAQQAFDTQLLDIADKESDAYRDIMRQSKIAENVHTDVFNEVNDIVRQYGYELKRQGNSDGLAQLFRDFSTDSYNSALFEKLLPIVSRFETKVLFTDIYSDSTLGSYNSGDNQLLLNATHVKERADMAVTILHELIHDATTYAQHGREKGAIDANSDLGRIAARASRLWQALLLSSSKPSYQYPLTNDRELLAGLSHEGFRQWLKSIDVYVDNATTPSRYSLFAGPSTAVRSDALTELEHILDGFFEKASFYEHSHINVPANRNEVHQHGVESERSNGSEDTLLFRDGDVNPQVYTPEFKAWFGDWENDPENASKVVNEDGTPRVVYHGTKMPFWTFDGGKSRGIFTDGLNYFALDRQFAEDWARRDDEKRRTPEVNQRLEAAKNKRREHEREIAQGILEKYDGKDIKYYDTPEYNEWIEDKDGRDLWERENLDLDGMTYLEALYELGKRVLPVYINARNPYNPAERYESEGKQMLIDLGLLEPNPSPMSEMYARGGAYLYYEDKKVIDELKRRGYDAIYLSENVWSDPSKNLRTIAVWDSNRIKSATENNGEFDTANDDIRFRQETDADVLERLDSEPKVTAYRAMQFIPDPNGDWEFDLGDGKGVQKGFLYPPMSAKVNGEWREPTRRGIWERSVEQPELADDKGRFKLDKGNKKSVPAAYNPYFHSSDTMLNDQFAEAQTRDNLVVVEVDVPEREVAENNMNPYHAEKAKDAVGKHSWKAGPIQQQLTGTRNVYLSRWDRPVRIVPVDEVADNVSAMVRGQVAEMPTNVVWPQLRTELEKRGVRFVETDNQGKFVDGKRKGKYYATEYKNTDKATAKERAKERQAEEKRIANLRAAELESTNATLDRMSEELGIQINRVPRTAMPIGHKSDKGYYNPATGEMTICMDNVTDERDAIATVLHETVGHHGLRQLFGDRFNDAMVRIYAALDANGRKWVNAYIARHPGADNTRAVEEYISHLAESGNFKNTVWDKIKEIFGRIVDALFGTNGFVLTDNELNYILRASYEHLKNPDWLNTVQGKAFDTLLKRRLGINETDPNKPTDPDGPGTGLLYRSGATGVANDDYNGFVDSWENKMLTENQDADLPVRIGYDVVMKEKGIKSISEDEDYVQRHNLASSRAESQAHEFELYKFSPLMDQVRAIQDKLTGASAKRNIVRRALDYLGFDRVAMHQRQDAYERILDYMYAVSGLERNDYKNAEIEADKQAALAGVKDPAKRAKIEARYDAMKRDWSGITSLMKTSPANWKAAEAQARAMIANFEKAVGSKGMLDELWNRVRACTDYSLEHAYKYGLLTREEFERLHGTASQPRMWNYYLPLRGFSEMTAEEQFSYANFTNPSRNSAVVKKMNGRWTQADNPLANILNIAETEIVQGNDNWAKQALYRFTLNAGDNTLLSASEPWYVKNPATGKWSLAFPDPGETLEEFEARMKALRALDDPLAKKGRQGLKLDNIMVNKAHRNEHAIHLKVGGIDKMIWVNGDPALARAVSGIGRAQNLQWLRRAGRLLSNLFTTYSLDFTAKNLIRDTTYSFIALHIKEDKAYRHQYYKNWIQNFGYGAFAYPMINLAAQWENGKLVQKEQNGTLTPRERDFLNFMRDGGQTGYTIINSVSQIKKDLEAQMRSAGGKPGTIPVLGHYAKAVKTLNEAFELLTRFTAYQTSRDMGRSGQRAASDAKEISVNFNRRGAQSGNGIWGNIAAYLGATHYFYNAGVQGFDNFLGLFKKKPGKMTTITAGFVMMGILTPLINSMLAGLIGGGDGDDDWYWNLPEWVRRNNLIIGTGKWYFAFPLPVEFRAPYGIGDIAGSAFCYEKYPNRHFGNVAGDILSTAAGILPVNPVEGYTGNGNLGDAALRAVAPDAGMFFVDWATNRDYTGRPLWKENPFSDTVPKSQGAYASTPKGIVAACQKLAEVSNGKIDIAPGLVRDFLQNYGGGFFRAAEDVSKIITGIRGKDPERPLRWDNVPFFSGFTGHIDEDRSNSFATNALYDYKKLSEDNVKSMNAILNTDDVSASILYDNPETLYERDGVTIVQKAKIKRMLDSKEYKLGKEYRKGMNNEYKMKQYLTGAKAGQWYKSREIERKGVDTLRKEWKEARDRWASLPDKTEEQKRIKADAYKDVTNAWHLYYDAQGDLAVKLMNIEYNKEQ